MSCGGTHTIVGLLHSLSAPERPCAVLSRSSCLTLCNPTDRSPPGSSVHGDSSGKNIGVACHVLLQGIFPTQGLNQGLLHCRWILYRLSHQRSPIILEWVAYPFSRESSWSRTQTKVSCIAGRFFTSWTTREAQKRPCSSSFIPDIEQKFTNQFKQRRQGCPCEDKEGACWGPVNIRTMGVSTSPSAQWIQMTLYGALTALWSVGEFCMLPVTREPTYVVRRRREMWRSPVFGVEGWALHLWTEKMAALFRSSRECSKQQWNQLGNLSVNSEMLQCWLFSWWDIPFVGNIHSKVHSLMLIFGRKQKNSVKQLFCN